MTPPTPHPRTEQPIGIAEIIGAISADKAMVSAAVNLGRMLFDEGKLSKEQLDDIEARGAASDAASDAHALEVAERLKRDG